MNLARWMDDNFEIVANVMLWVLMVCLAIALTAVPVAIVGAVMDDDEQGGQR